MGITVSFIFCLLSGFACFWLFWNALTGLKQFREENLFYVHNTICSRYHTFQLFDVCAHSSREVLI